MGDNRLRRVLMSCENVSCLFSSAYSHSRQASNSNVAPSSVKARCANKVSFRWYGNEMMWSERIQVESNPSGAHMRNFSVGKSLLNHFYEIFFYCPAGHLSSALCYTPHNKTCPHHGLGKRRKTHLMSNLSKIIKSLRELETILRICLLNMKKRKVFLPFCFLFLLFFHCFILTIGSKTFFGGNYCRVCSSAPARDF